MRAGIDCRAVAPESGGIGAFSRSALESLARHGGGRKFLAVLPNGMAERIGLPADFAAASAEDMPLWGELQLPSLLEEFGAEVFFSPLFTCPVVRSARNVVTLHDVFPESHPELCTPEFLRFWKARIGPSLRSACHALAVSEWSKAQAVERLKLAPGRVSVVRQSVGDRFRPVGRSEADPVLARHGLGFGLYILYVGAIDPRKNPERLARAFSLLKSSELTLAIAGQPASKGYSLDGIIRETGLGDRVKLLGYVADADLPLLFATIAATTVFVILAIAKPERAWFDGRAAAESIKSLAWQFMLGVKQFSLKLSQAEAEKAFQSAIMEIMQERKLIAASCGSYSAEVPEISGIMRSLRTKSVSERLNTYLEQRVRDQRGWYARKAAWNSKRQVMWFILIALAHGAAILSAALYLRNPSGHACVTPAIAALATAMFSWLQIKKHQDLVQSYGMAAQELGVIEEQARHVTTEDELDQIVTTAETAISREHTMWVARRNY